jgi:pimeloyl-ACP methyl ester carboxylesterase
MVDQDSFEPSEVEVSGNTIFIRRYGKGPAILMVHGFPRTSLMWRFLAPRVAENHTVVCVDLRAYGRSGIPVSTKDNPFGQGSFGKEILDEYVSTYRDPARVHGICEEYRAGATIDVEHDRADKEASRRIECPMLHLWAEGGPLDTFYARDGGQLGIWRQWAPRAQGQAMKGGHFLPEENPGDTAAIVKRFLSA